jgi:uncharacterized protein (DUF302 family)
LLEESVSDTPSDLVTTKSPHPFQATLERLESAAKSAGLVVFGHLDHAAAAQSAGLHMPPATVLVVGNPKAGTPQFLQHPTLAIDLPLKMLVWENQAGDVFVSYNSSAFALATLKRHGFDTSQPALTDGTDALAQKLADVTRAALA